MSLKLDGTGKITGIDQGLNVVGVGTFSTDLDIGGDVVVGGGLTVTGVLTYEDVTNVDSIGIITARSGIIGDLTGNVTGDITGNIIGSPTLSGISSSITDTAVDVFVYDTSKDSDGGAWRKRTQHTSWYNETLNTSTRGSRREFPSVAVIVVETGKVTIYDGDDPDLTMWMVFNQGVPKILYTTATCASMLNGKLVFGTDPNSANYYDGGIKVIDFISESIRSYSYASSIINYNLNISQRNDDYTGAYYSNSDGVLTSPNVTDVAMTVASTAPIDDATGLPVPTIAVGTRDGLSIIKDDGSVIDYTHQNASYDYTSFVEFLGDDRVAYAWDNSATPRRVFITPVRPTDTATVDPNSYPRDIVDTVGYGRDQDNKDVGNYHGHLLGNDQSVAAGMNGSMLAVGDGSDGLNLVDVQGAGDDTFNSRIAFITKDYNTGWQYGNIKGAFLSDTDTTNLVQGDILGGKGTFDDASYWTVGSSWTVSGGVATATSGSNSYLQKNGILTTGARYVIKFTVSSYSTGTLYVYCGTGAPGLQNHYLGVSANGTYTAILDAYNTNFGLYSTGFAGVVDDVTVSSVVDQDRSVNGKDLGVIGTITKSAVATGAELVAYSGFTDNDYLTQPYNSDLDFGTGDYYMSIWAKGGADSQTLMIREHGVSSGNGLDADGAILIFQGGNKYNFYSRQNGTATWTAFSANNATYGDYWSHVVLVRTGGTLYGYVNGKLEGSTSFAGDVSNDDAEIYIGRRNPNVNNTQEYSGSLALAKIGGSAPTAEQVKKMYEDEKHLFQENATCTLYGSSDAVTALAYDEVTDRLHVGTSSGRSDFQGLRRINNTTTAVTTAISAHDEFIAEQ